MYIKNNYKFLQLRWLEVVTKFLSVGCVFRIKTINWARRKCHVLLSRGPRGTTWGHRPPGCPLDAPAQTIRSSNIEIRSTEDATYFHNVRGTERILAVHYLEA